MFKGAIAFALLFFTIATSTLGQVVSTATTGHNARKTHWRKYASKEFHFSFRYPSSYRTSDFSDSCQDNQYVKYLLCAQERDDSDFRIMVTVIVGSPFFVKSDRGDVKYSPERIGHHLFYCGLGGSMGTGFSDECTFNLRNKVLEFNFSPAKAIHTRKTDNPLVLEVLRTLRVQ